MKTEIRSKETGELTGVYYTYRGAEKMRLRAGRRNGPSEWHDYNSREMQNITDIRKRWQRRKELRARRKLKQPDIML